MGGGIRGGRTDDGSPVKDIVTWPRAFDRLVMDASLPRAGFHRIDGDLRRPFGGRAANFARGSGMFMREGTHHRAQVLRRKDHFP